MPEPLTPRSPRRGTASAGTPRWSPSRRTPRTRSWRAGAPGAAGLRELGSAESGRAQHGRRRGDDQRLLGRCTWRVPVPV